MYVCVGKTVYMYIYIPGIWFGTIRAFRHLLGLLDKTSVDKGRDCCIKTIQVNYTLGFISLPPPFLEQNTFFKDLMEIILNCYLFM